MYCLVNNTLTFGTKNVYVCVFCSVMTAVLSIFFPNHALCFDLHRCTLQFFSPPLHSLAFAYFHPRTCTGAENISVAMETLSEAPRVPDKASLSRPFYCVSLNMKADTGRVDIDVIVKLSLCTFFKAVYEHICAL